MEGVVQGVGFRPFVYGLASRLGLGGLVGNDAGGVFCEVEGEAEAVRSFIEALQSEGPPLAVVERLTSRSMAARGETVFSIVDSHGGDERGAQVSPDAATCDDCLREVFDSADRRHLYPFTSCSHCGPRFSIVNDVPYDRANTTMSAFPLCDRCAREYEDPFDRRFHAQSTCCADCGPHLVLLDRALAAVAGNAVEQTVRLLSEGRVVAVKGLGGYHLAADAACEPAVAALRARKHREEKPFALMAPDLDSARRLCRLTPADEAVLCGRRRPVVLAPRQESAAVARSVAPGNRCLGVMLPYTPLHHLLAGLLGRPLVLTSGNVSDEPIAYLDGDAFERLGRIAEGFLTHDRPIHIRTDDSVTRTFRGRELLLRRSRGYAPQPLRLAFTASSPVLACGAELKHTFCLAKGPYAFVSHHIGDLENYETLRSFVEGVEHFRRLFEIDPEIVAYDLHPEYLSTKYALELEGVQLVGVQHHHAHIASCLADNGEPGPVIGVAFDGSGYGPDGTLWGGELMVADLKGFERVGHLALTFLPGGTAAIKEPWRMAVAWLDAAFGDEAPADLPVTRRHRQRWDDVRSVGRAGVGSPLTSSAGRLFDAMAALVGLRDAVTYEGQAAIELEQLADPTVTDAYPLSISPGPPLRLESADLVRAAVGDLRAGAAPARVAARFHNGLADGVVRACLDLRQRYGLSAVALSGGVFQNVFFLGRIVDGLETEGFRVLLHSRVPPNDGGISLGQTAVAAATGLTPGPAVSGGAG